MKNLTIAIAFKYTLPSMFVLSIAFKYEFDSIAFLCCYLGEQKWLEAAIKMFKHRNWMVESANSAFEKRDDHETELCFRYATGARSTGY